MSRPSRIPVLVFDDDPWTVEDYRIVLEPSYPNGGNPDSLGLALEAELFGSRTARGRFPEVELTVTKTGRATIDAVSQAVEHHRPFRVAFISLGLSPAYWGLDIAATLRVLDPRLHIVLTISEPGPSPVDLCEQIAPADRLSLLHKPLHAHEIEQLVLAAEARHARDSAVDLERWQARDVAARALSDLALGLIVTARDRRIVVAAGDVSDILPRYRGALVPGTYLPEGLSWIAEPRHAGSRAGEAPSSCAIREIRLDDGRCVVAASARSRDGGAICLFLDVTDLKLQEAARVRQAQSARLAAILSAFRGGLNAVLRESARPRPRAASTSRAKPGLVGRFLSDRLQELMRQLDAAIVVPAELATLDDLERRLTAIAARRAADYAGSAVDVSAESGLWGVRLPTAGFESAMNGALRLALGVPPSGRRVRVHALNVRLDREQVSKQGLVGEDFVCISFVAMGLESSRFRHGDASSDCRPARPEGAGNRLGLCLAQLIVLQVDGFVKVRSDTQGGERVEIYLPRAVTDSGAPQPVREPGNLRRSDCTPEYQAGA